VRWLWRGVVGIGDPCAGSPRSPGRGPPAAPLAGGRGILDVAEGRRERRLAVEGSSSAASASAYRGASEASGSSAARSRRDSNSASVARLRRPVGVPRTGSPGPHEKLSFSLSSPTPRDAGGRKGRYRPAPIRCLQAAERRRPAPLVQCQTPKTSREREFESTSGVVRIGEPTAGLVIDLADSADLEVMHPHRRRRVGDLLEAIGRDLVGQGD